ncbi:MAG: DUF3892 domain-containing protein [Dehalococcoidia bacterium]
MTTQQIATLQVTCVLKDSSSDPCHRIQGVGGATWYYTVDEVIAHIEAGRARFYTLVNGRSADVIVAVNPRSGRKYIKTTADGYEPNNLLALPSCR